MRPLPVELPQVRLRCPSRTLGADCSTLAGDGTFGDVLGRQHVVRTVCASVGRVHERGGVRGEREDRSVPRISSFYGIDIEMFFDDHAPPHFHARYAGAEALIVIATGEIYAGSLPGRALRLVREWLEEHRDELARNFERAVALEPLETIPPLP